MFGSIRWRLVASYVLITLLTVSLVGVLTLSLVRRDIRRQETAHLEANAQAIATQALPLMQPVIRRAELSELAHTASFFANAQVRILDNQRRILADSGPGSDIGQFIWIEPAVRFPYELDDRHTTSGPVIMAFPGGDSILVPGLPGERLTALRDLATDAEITVVRRIEGPWGGRIIFHRLSHDQLPAVPTISVEDIQESAVTEEAPRPEQVLVVPIGPPNRPRGFVELGTSSNLGTETLATTRRALLLAAVGATSLAVIVGLLVGRGLTAPLRSLTAAASRMSGDDLSARAPIRGKDEIGQLGRQFNQMADRLETSFAELAAERDALRRFIADASHELRTPITALKTFNELLQGQAADEPTARVEFLSESQIQIDRLERITHNLLDLSRLDAGLVHLDLADHPVVELIQTAVAAFRSLADEKEIDLCIQEPVPDVTLQCDRARIESALCNLLDNAVKFTPPGGKVKISAVQAEKTLQLWVQDDGPGIRPDEVSMIFERFYRGADSPAEGSGLGLAIVHSVVQAHRGRVFVESKIDEGSRFVIELPLAGQLTQGE